MITISLCMIVKNEEKVLDRCLKSVRDIVDEIIIVDTGSSDKTKEIAKRYTDLIYDFEWINDFSAARNYAFSKGTKEYLMWLDADDVILEEDRRGLKELKESLDPTTDVVMMKYNVGIDENGMPSMSYYRERILKREKDFRWSDPIHEVIAPYGVIDYKDIAITHKKEFGTDPKRNLNIYESMIEKGIEFSARQMFYYSRELYYNAMYDKAIESFNKFLEDPSGWVENKISACKDLATCYELLGESQKAITTLFRSFIYSKPRAEICCDIGNYFFNKDDYKTSIFWYETAISQDPNEQTGGFFLLDCYGFTPSIQLCVCYDRLGDRKNAIKYNEEAAKHKPNSPSVNHNRDYFNSLK